MKKSFLVIACAILSISIFAQTPQQPLVSSTNKEAKQTAQVKKDHNATQSSKETLANDKSKKKADAAKHVSSTTKKADKEQVKADKSTVKANKKTQKKDKKSFTKKEPASGAAGSLSTPPRQ